MGKRTKTYLVDGKKYLFNQEMFLTAFDRCRKRKGLNIGKMEELIAVSIDVSKDSVRKWRNRQNAPSDIGKIEDLANLLGIREYTELLLEEKKGELIIYITERQKDSLKRIYDSVIEFLDIFKKTNGYNDLWFDYEDIGMKSKDIKSALYDFAEEEQDKVILTLKKEYIELFRLEVYSLLEDFVYDFLCEIYNGKLDYGYRFEADVENVDGTRTARTTEEDYYEALYRIREILTPYM